MAGAFVHARDFAHQHRGTTRRGMPAKQGAEHVSWVRFVARAILLAAAARTQLPGQVLAARAAEMIQVSFSSTAVARLSHDKWPAYQVHGRNAIDGDLSAQLVGAV